MLLKKKKKDNLFLMLLETSENLNDSAQYFADFKIKEEKHLDEFQRTMKDYEHKGDDLVSNIIQELNNSFITPIEREDALALATNMDRILDELEECAAHFHMFNIYHIDDYMKQFSEILKNCVGEIEDAVKLICQKKLTEIRQHTIKVKEYEHDCDILEKKAIMDLFKNQKDVITLIQYKEIYESFESAADMCQKVAKVLDTVVMKNA